MAGKRTLLNTALGLGLLAAMAFGQPASAQKAASDSNDVTVHALKKPLPAEIQDFVKSYDAPSRIGQLSRWEDKICPKTIGLPDAGNAFVSYRVLDIARKVGAPVANQGVCTPNMLIVFALQPQALLDAVREKRPGILGFHYTAGEAKKLATMTYPVQAWYATATQDLNGRVTPDDPDDDWVSTSNPQDILDNATHVKGSRLSLGLQSNFSTVLVIVDGSKVEGRPVATLADYIAVLALSKAKTLDACRDLETIANLFAANCPDGAGVDTATDVDLAFLHGLYDSDPTLLGYGQQAGIEFEMNKALKPK